MVDLPDRVPLQVALRDGGERTVTAERVFVNVGTHATIPAIPGLADAKPMTHVDALDLERLPEHLIVLGGGYVGLEFAQAMRRFGSRVTLIARGPQLAPKEDADVAQAILELFRDEGIDVAAAHASSQCQRRFGRARTSAGARRRRHANGRRNGYSRCAWAYAEHTRNRLGKGGNRSHGGWAHTSK